jgi:hypothetical protein
MDLVNELFISTKSPRVAIKMSQIMAIMPYDERPKGMIYRVYLTTHLELLIEEDVAKELFEAFAEYSKG